MKIINLTNHKHFNQLKVKWKLIDIYNLYDLYISFYNIVIPVRMLSLFP